MGTEIVAKWAALSTTAFPADAAGTLQKPSPTTLGKAFSAWACDIIRPPNDLPPAMSGIDGSHRTASATAARTVRVGQRWAIGPLGAVLGEGKLIPKRRHLSLCEAVGHSRHERVVHASAGAVRQHVAGHGVRRDGEEGGDLLCLGHLDGQRNHVRSLKMVGRRYFPPWSSQRSGIRVPIAPCRGSRCHVCRSCPFGYCSVAVRWYGWT